MSYITSKQSFFLCVIAPQFSQAPFRYFIARDACIPYRIIGKLNSVQTHMHVYAFCWQLILYQLYIHKAIKQREE